MNGEIRFVAQPEQRSKIAREVLLDLPEWFGIPEYTENYIRACAEMPLWVCEQAGDITGFIAIKETSPYAVELNVMGVKKAQPLFLAKKPFFRVYNRFFTVYNKHCAREQDVNGRRDGTYA